jgi:hypothetical protein
MLSRLLGADFGDVFAEMADREPKAGYANDHHENSLNHEHGLASTP